MVRIGDRVLWYRSAHAARVSGPCASPSSSATSLRTSTARRIQRVRPPPKILSRKAASTSANHVMRNRRPSAAATRRGPRPTTAHRRGRAAGACARRSPDDRTERRQGRPVGRRRRRCRCVPRYRNDAERDDGVLREVQPGGLEVQGGERHVLPRHLPPGGRRSLRHGVRSSPQPELRGQRVLLALDHPESLLQALPRERTERGRVPPGRRATTPARTCRVWCSSRICQSNRNASSNPRRRSSLIPPATVTSCSRRSVRFSVSPDMTALNARDVRDERDAAVLHVQRERALPFGLDHGVLREPRRRARADGQAARGDG